jgi:hypothetical protein
MGQTDATQPTDRFDGHYLPGMPQLSAEPSRVERFLSTLFRRRGGFTVVVQNSE